MSGDYGPSAEEVWVENIESWFHELACEIRKTNELLEKVLEELKGKSTENEVKFWHNY